VVALEKQRLRNGTISYARAGARVDVRLALRQPGGKVCEEFTSFLGHAASPRRMPLRPARPGGAPVSCQHSAFSDQPEHRG